MFYFVTQMNKKTKGALGRGASLCLFIQLRDKTRLIYDGTARSLFCNQRYRQQINLAFTKIKKLNSP